jgi:pimeloyl-ACP methyl ester carboxylesterase
MTVPTPSPKPTILLVPGAWHTPDHFQLLITKLEQLSYPTVSQRLPSVGSSTPLSVTATTDVDFVRNTLLLPLLEAGTDVVVLSHSYGGFVGGAAAKGLSKQERVASGQKGGVIGLIFIAAFIGPTGSSLTALGGGRSGMDPRIDIDVSIAYL